MKTAIIGCGSIGHKRAGGLSANADLVGCFDINSELSKNFALQYAIKQFESLDEILSDSSIDFVIVATTHNALADIAIKALKNSKHVFIEKPGSISAKLLRKIVQISRERKLIAHIGYNHRYHPAISKAISMANSGEIGPIMFLRARYGHGGRLGYENEWRFKKDISGGGELIDQGTHLIDISLAILGDLALNYALTPTYFWKSEVEDNAFICLSTDEGSVAFLHASCTEWKNTFSLEIYGKNAKVEVSGLGRSYGTETLKVYRMKPQMGPPKIERFEFAEQDVSWELEIKEFIEDIERGTNRTDNLNTSVRVLEIVEDIYVRNNK